MTGSKAQTDTDQLPQRHDFAENGVDFFSQAGAFDTFPGAALLVGNNGITLTANGTGELIANLLRTNDLPLLREAIRSALNGSTGQVNPLVIPKEGGDTSPARAFDMLVLPWAEGATALLLGREITLERGLRAALVESRQRFKDLVDLAAEFAWECDLEGRFTFLSRNSVLGYPADDLIGREAQSLALKERHGGPLPFTARAECRDQEIWMKTSDGDGLCLAVTAVPLYNEDQGQVGTRGLCRDVTALRQREAEEADARYLERLLNYVLQMVRDQLDPRGMLKAAADALQLAVGARGVAVYRLEPGVAFKIQSRAGEAFPATLEQQFLAEIGGGEVLEVQNPQGSALVQMTRSHGKDNGLLCLWRYEDDEPWRSEERELVNVVALEVATAIEQLIRQEALERLSETDPLTGLLNRRGFVSQLEARLECVGQQCGGALIYIDLDDFKRVNDSAGHKVGDELLTKTAKLLQDQVREDDLAGRLGGDEFALFLDGIDQDSVVARTEALQEAWVSEVQSANLGVKIGGLSIGVALIDGETRESARSLIERGDQAMYRVKHGGKDGYALSSAAPSAQEGQQPVRKSERDD